LWRSDDAAVEFHGRAGRQHPRVQDESRRRPEWIACRERRRMSKIYEALKRLEWERAAYHESQQGTPIAKMRVRGSGVWWTGGLAGCVVGFGIGIAAMAGTSPRWRAASPETAVTPPAPSPAVAATMPPVEAAVLPEPAVANAPPPEAIPIPEPPVWALGSLLLLAAGFGFKRRLG